MNEEQKYTSEDRQNPSAYLPKLKGDFALMGRIGEWSSQGNMLSSLPENLELEEDTKVSAEVLTAIPTIWARPLLFRTALFNKDHPLHDEVKNEWRGILGVFALHQFFGININDPKLCSIDEESPKTLDKVLVTLNPWYPKKEWLNLYLVKVDNKLIAGTSPSTFFFTPPDFPVTRIQWRRKDGRLYDPARCLQNSRNYQQLRFLKGWISKVWTDARSKRGSLISTYTDIGRIIDLLEDWLKDKDLKDVEAQGVALLPASTQDSDGFYSLVTRSIDKSATEFEIKSDYLLKPSRNLTNTPIIIWPEQWDDPQKFVFTNFTSNHVSIPTQASGEKLENGSIKHFWIRPEKYFFTEKILRLKMNKDKVFLYHEKGYIPPLKSELLSYFYPEEISQLFEWRNNVKEKDSVEVALHLPLVDGRTATFKKIYTKEMTIESKGDPPLMAIWPDFKAEDWSYYYLLFEEKKKDYQKYDFYPRYGDREPEKDEKHIGEHRLAHMFNCPEALECKYDKEPVGLLLLNWGTSLEKGTQKWKVAVDFGTSNTTICMRQGDQISLLPFKERSFVLTSVPRETAVFQLSPRFFPSEEVKQTFATIFRRFTTNPVLPEAIKDGVINFEHPQFLDLVYKQIREEIVENLKWSFNSDDRKYLSAFLQQLILMMAAEARARGIGRIELQWSYPSAFSTGLKIELEGTWLQQTTQLQDRLGVEIRLSEGETESTAVCRNMILTKRAPIMADRPQVIVDVGGGTTDIGIWQRGNLLMQTSFRLAGNNIAELFFSQVNLINALHQLAGISPIMEPEEIVRNKSYAHYNLIIKFGKKNILQALNTGSNRSPEFILVRSAILFLFNSIFYNLGLLLRKLIQDGSASPDIYLAGNGSMLLEWVNPWNAILPILISSTKRGFSVSGKSGDLRIFEPKDPKTEVAYGLLDSSGNLKSDTSPTVCIGEVGYKLDGKDLNWYEDLRTIIDLNPDVFRRIELPNEFQELRTLIKVNDDAANSFQLHSVSNRVSFEVIKAYVQNRLAREAERKAADVFYEPFLIMEAAETLTEAFKK
jgi:hypothetical protein